MSADVNSSRQQDNAPRAAGGGGGAPGEAAGSPNGSLSAEDRRLRAMLAHSFDVVKLLSPEGTILYANPAAKKVLGFAPGQLVGLPATEFLHPDDVDRVMARFARVAAAGPSDQPVTLTYRCRCAEPPDQYCWMEGVLTNLLGEPDVGAVVLNERNIEARRRAEEDRDELLVREQAARAQAEAAIQARDTFLSIVSHELRTPLTPVLLCVSDLQRDPNLTDRAREELAMIREQVELEARIIDDLLDLTRIGQGTLQLDLRPVDAHEVLHQALAAADREVREKQLDVTLEFRAACSRVTADAGRLRQVFFNLVSNAAKFTPAGGTITVATEDAAGPGPDECRLRVTVTDTGVGFRPEVAEKMFKPFEQAEQTLTRRFGGLGLGLTIAKELVDLHHGTISASSQGADRGATFAIELPAVRPPAGVGAAAQQQQQQQRRQSQQAAGEAARPLSVLLVEDNPQTLAAMARVLGAAGHRVYTAQSVDSALRVLEDEAVDVMVCDIGLPDGSGWELLRRAGAIRTVPAIALSGFSSDADVDRSRRAGFVAHLVKPVTPQKLKDAIRQATTTAAPPAGRLFPPADHGAGL